MNLRLDGGCRQIAHVLSHIYLIWEMIPGSLGIDCILHSYLLPLLTLV